MTVENSGSWLWVASSVVLVAHDRQVAEHGGADGIRDPEAIDSALARTVNLAAHDNPDATELAAAYIYGLAMSHGFIDGNKRTAWVTARVFLADNGCTLDFDPLDAVRVMEDVAAARTSEPELANWFRLRLRG